MIRINANGIIIIIIIIFLPHQSDSDNESSKNRCNNIVSYEYLWIRRTCEDI